MTDIESYDLRITLFMGSPNYQHFKIEALTALAEIKDLIAAGEMNGLGMDLPGDLEGGFMIYAHPSDLIPLALAEQRLIQKTLTHFNGNRTKAAKLLGISIRTLRNKIKQYGGAMSSYSYLEDYLRWRERYDVPLILSAPAMLEGLRTIRDRGWSEIRWPKIESICTDLIKRATGESK